MRVPIFKVPYQRIENWFVGDVERIRSATCDFFPCVCPRNWCLDLPVDCCFYGNRSAILHMNVEIWLKPELEIDLTPQIARDPCFETVISFCFSGSIAKFRRKKRGT